MRDFKYIMCSQNIMLCTNQYCLIITSGHIMANILKKMFPFQEMENLAVQKNIQKYYMNWINIHITLTLMSCIDYIILKSIYQKN